MTIEEYLNDLLESQELSSDQEAALQSHKDEVTKFLRTEFGNDPVIKYAGSHAKGTMIADQYDLDIVCYFPSTDERTLKEIHDDMAKHLQEKYTIEEKASAVRITNLKDDGQSDYHIDVVPGRFIEDTKDVFLHVTYGDKERMQTNLKTHIDYIKKSGCVDVIRIAKLWAHRNNLAIKTFILELFIVESLKGYELKNNLHLAFLKVLEKLKDDFATMQLIDPANSGNVVSKPLHSSFRTMIAEAADVALEKVMESEDIADWKAVFQEADAKQGGSPFVPSIAPAVIKNPSGQWAK